MYRLRAVYALVPLALAVLLLPAASQGADPYSRLYELYARTVELSLRGVETGRLEELLASAVDSIESGDYAKASELLAEAEGVQAELEGRAGAEVLTKNLVRYGTAAAAMSVPVLVYLLLPRVYVYLWYTARKSWVVANERPR